MLTTIKMTKTGALIISLVIVVVIIGGIFLFNGSSDSSDVTDNTQNSGTLDTGQTPPPFIDDNQESGQDDTGTSSDSSETKEFDIVARQWNFNPDTITVNEGDTVILNINSIDVNHGFAIKEFGVSESLNPGNTVRVEFIADRKGSFSFFCNVQCGSGHTRMRGTLIVEWKS